MGRKSKRGYTHTHPHSHTHAYSHTRTHTHTHTRTHIGKNKKRATINSNPQRKEPGFMSIFLDTTPYLQQNHNIIVQATAIYLSYQQQFGKSSRNEIKKSENEGVLKLDVNPESMYKQNRGQKKLTKQQRCMQFSSGWCRTPKY